MALAQVAGLPNTLNTIPPNDEEVRRLAWVRRREQLILFGFAAPLVLVLIVFFAVPIVAFLSRSFLEPTLTMEHFAHAMDPVYLKVLWITIELTFFVTLASLVTAYPLAYVLANSSGKVQAILLSLVIISLWTSQLVKAYAWMILLGDAGVINKLLISNGLREEPLRMLYNRTGAIIGMTQAMLPFMVLPIFSVMVRIPTHLVQVAESLGAGPFRAFLRVYLPLSLPGVGAGVLLVFIITLGFFITPALLGGPNAVMMAMVIEQQVATVFNWGFAAALSVILLVITLLLYAVYARYMSFEKLYGGDTDG